MGNVLCLLNRPLRWDVAGYLLSIKDVPLDHYQCIYGGSNGFHKVKITKVKSRGIKAMSLPGERNTESFFFFFFLPHRSVLWDEVICLQAGYLTGN